MENTLIKHLDLHQNEVTQANHSRILHSARSTSWAVGAGGAAVLTLSIIALNPKAWLPVAYVGGSVAISLGVGSVIESNKSNHWRKVRDAIEVNRPLDSVAKSWLKSRQPVEPQAVLAPEPPQNAQEAPLTDPSRELAANPSSSLIGGISGSGKSLFVLSAIDHLVKLKPHIKITFLDPKNSPKETPTLPSTVSLKRYSFRESSVDTAASWLLNELEIFNAYQGPKLLVIDELASVLTTLKLASRELKALPTFKAFISHLTSMGASDQHYVWLVTQDVSVDVLGISTSLRAQLQAIALVSPVNRNSLRAFIGGGWIPKHPDGEAGLDAVMGESPVNRAYYSGRQGRWLPLPEIRNLTGHDRDHEQQILPTPKHPQHISTVSPSHPSAQTSFFEDDANLMQVEGQIETLGRPDEPTLSYLEMWEEWLANCGDSEVSVRYATQYAPRQIRGSVEETKAAFTQLAKAGIGQFDGKVLTLNPLANSSP